METGNPCLEERDDEVVVELPLELRVNGRSVAVLMRTPGMDEELAVGFCITEGLIRDADQIRAVRCARRPEEREEKERSLVEGKECRDAVEVELVEGDLPYTYSAGSVVKTACGGMEVGPRQESWMVAYDPGLKLKGEILFGLARKLEEGQSIFPRTGGTHGAAVFEADGTPLVVVEDVGRHNAVDKAVGWCAVRGVARGDKLLFISGRISYEMALKAARAGIPLLASVAAPTSLGITLAERAGLTLVGFCGQKRCNLYTHPWRIR